MSPSLDDLSQSMTSDEKKNLLGKIQASLNLAARDTDSIISKAEAPEELKHRLTKEVIKLGFLDRWLIRVAAFFRSRSEYEIMADRKLEGPRQVIRDRIPDLVTFSREEWSPEFARRLYDLYAEVALLKPVFDHLFQQKLTFEAGMLLLIREEHSTAIRSLQDILPDQEIAEVYRKDQKRSSLQTRLEEKLTSTLDGMPASVFERVRDRLRSIYYLRPLIQFPYEYLFELFGHTPGKGDVVKYPYFLGAPWRKTAGLFERLYYGLYLVNKIDWREGGLNQLFQGVVDRLSDEKTPWTLELLNQRFSSVIRITQELVQKLPWKEVLKWSFQDPYYGVKYVLPRFSVLEFYQTTLTMNLREELDQRIPLVRQQLLAEERNILFEGGTYHPLEYYIPGQGASLSGNQKVQGFQYPETIALLWGFLNLHFVKKIQPFHQSLTRMVAPASKVSLQALNNVVEELGIIKAKVHQFDQNLHPDNPEGKEFLKLRYELNSRALGLKPFLQLVQNKDSQALEFIGRALGALEALEEQLTGVRTRNIPALNAVLKLPYLLEGQQENIENGLDRLLVIVQKTLFVLREAESLES